MFDPEYTISLYFNGDAALTQADIDQLSDWIEQSEENTAKFIQASFMHRAIHDSLVGADIKNVLLDLKEATNSAFDVVMDSNVSVGDVDVNEEVVDDYGLPQDSNIMQAMLELAESERTAPAVIIEKPVEVKPLIRNVDNSNFKIFAGKVNKLSLFAAVFMATAFLSMLAYVHFMPKPVDPPIVAQLVDSIDAVWDEYMQLPDFDDYMRQNRYRLTAGLVGIRFNNGAKITVEAPAEWSLLGGGNMELFGGRIYAVVPEQAHGFTVMAGNSKVVDLGTEFGIEVDKDNNTHLHVTKGKTLLFTGLLTGKKSQVNVSEGTAKKVSSGGFVRDIDVASKHFVRDIRAPYTTLSVPNGSFEKLAFNKEVWIDAGNGTVGIAPSWSTLFKPVGTNIWMLDSSPNGGAIAPDAVYGYGGIAAEGKNFGYIRTDLKSDHCLYQKLAFSLQSLRTYDLSVKVGNPSLYNDGAAGAYRIELLAGGVVIASGSGASPADDSKWITASVSYTSGPDKAADSNIGQPLAIRLVAKAFTEKKHLNFDDVRLRVKFGTGSD